MLNSIIAILYKLTKKLANILSLPLTLHRSLAPNLKRQKTRDPDSHKFDNVPPELAFMATCVVVLKMVYGLDGQPRCVISSPPISPSDGCSNRLPKNSNDPACALPRLDEYLGWIRELDEIDLNSEDAKFNSDTHMSVPGCLSVGP